MILVEHQVCIVTVTLIRLNFSLTFEIRMPIIFYFGYFFFILGLTSPFLLGDGEIFLEANPITRPIHIVPE